MKTRFFCGLAAALALSACGRDERSTGREYAPQMYHPISYEPYTQLSVNKFSPDGKNMREPAPGTVARGKVDYYYPLPNTNEGYERAAKEIKNPVPPTEANLAEGARLYGLFCSHCHGAEGAGDGPVAAKFAQPPAYKSRAYLAEGQIFHSIYWGKNAMGAHGTQLTPEEIWKITHHVRKLMGFDPVAPAEQKLAEDKKQQALKQ
ncbi:MAG: cytochrome c [Bacteroidia bacterium]|nr:cytochrome c [Bacteroidia bacterium]MDW8334311.1 cytochrome c [Bacteroidia bacterium]